MTENQAINEDYALRLEREKKAVMESLKTPMSTLPMPIQHEFHSTTEQLTDEFAQFAMAALIRNHVDCFDLIPADDSEAVRRTYSDTATVAYDIAEACVAEKLRRKKT